MDAVFLNLVNISITASYIAIAVTVFRFLQKSTQEIHLHTLASCCIGLILPNSDNMFIFTSIFSLIPSTEVLPNTLIDNTSPQFNINVGVEQIDKRINAFLDNRYAEGVTVPYKYREQPYEYPWICMDYRMYRHSYLCCRQLYLFTQKTRASICVKGNTFICDYISTPFILGIIRPKILLPSTLAEEEKKYVIAHEKAHPKKGLTIYGNHLDLSCLLFIGLIRLCGYPTFYSAVILSLPAMNLLSEL